MKRGGSSCETNALAVPCTTLHVSVLPVADAGPAAAVDAPVGRPPDDETAEPSTGSLHISSQGVRHAR